MLFVDDMVLVNETSSGGHARLEVGRQTLLRVQVEESYVIRRNVDLLRTLVFRR